VKAVRLVGHGGDPEWKNAEDGLRVKLPAGVPTPIAAVLKIEGDVYI